MRFLLLFLFLCFIIIFIKFKNKKGIFMNKDKKQDQESINFKDFIQGVLSYSNTLNKSVLSS